LNASLHNRYASQELNISNLAPVGFFSPSPSPAASYLEGYISPQHFELNFTPSHRPSQIKPKRGLSRGFDKYIDLQSFDKHFDLKGYLNRQAHNQIQSARNELLKSPMSQSKGFQELKDLPKLRLIETPQSKWDDTKARKIWGDCIKLMDEYSAIQNPFPTRKKKKVKRFESKTPRVEVTEQQQQQTERKKAFEFWKKDEAFLKQRAQMEEEINKHREKVDKKNRIQDLLADDNDEAHANSHYENESQSSGRGMMKLIASKPRIFAVKPPTQILQARPGKEKDTLTLQTSPSFANKGQKEFSISANFGQDSGLKPLLSAREPRGVIFSSISSRGVKKSPKFLSQKSEKFSHPATASGGTRDSIIQFPSSNEGKHNGENRVKSLTSRIKRTPIGNFFNQGPSKNASLLLKEKLAEMDEKMAVFEKKCRTLSLLPSGVVGKNGFSIQQLYRCGPRRTNKANENATGSLNGSGNGSPTGNDN